MKKKKQSLIDKECNRYRNEINHGKMLCIDPSSGSQGSQPGYSVWDKGVLIDSGYIDIGTKRSRTEAERLYALRKCLEDSFDKPDIVVVERIVLNARAKGYCNPAVIKINKSIGAVMSQWGVPVIEVSPTSWKATAKKLEDYDKTDEWDAIALGFCVLSKVNGETE